MPLLSAKLTHRWGADVVRPAREAEHLTRPMLATLSGVAESTIKNLEVSNHQPTRSTIARLCEALDLPSPLSGAELRISLDEVDYPTAVRTLRAALDEYITARADPGAFADSRRVSHHDRPEVMHDAIEAFDAGQKLLEQLPRDTHRGHMTDAKKTRAPRWARRREEANLTQEETAIRAGLSMPQLRAIELGKLEPTKAQAKNLDAVLAAGAARPAPKARRPGRHQ